jgi:hypothetical protein
MNDSSDLSSAESFISTHFDRAMRATQWGLVALLLAAGGEAALVVPARDARPPRAYGTPCRVARSALAMCDGGAAGAGAAGGPDALLLGAMDALRGAKKELAKQLVAEARAAYESIEPTQEQLELLELVSARVDASLVPGFSKKEAARPTPPTKEELAARTQAKLDGDRQLMEAVQVFSNKADGERYGKALELLEAARQLFRRAGADVERERDAVMGNLYAAIRAEEERAQRVAKLVRMKKMLELVKQKRKAEALGIDPDTFEARVNGSEETADSAAATSSDAPGVEVVEGAAVTEEILEAWRSEGVDPESIEVDRIQREIDELEDLL